jgi:hypothetical protein
MTPDAPRPHDHQASAWRDHSSGPHYRRPDGEPVFVPHAHESDAPRTEAPDLRAALANDNPDRLLVWRRGTGYLSEAEAYDAILAALSSATPTPLDALDSLVLSGAMDDAHAGCVRIVRDALAARLTEAGS